MLKANLLLTLILCPALHGGVVYYNTPTGVEYFNFAFTNVGSPGYPLIHGPGGISFFDLQRSATTSRFETSISIIAEGDFYDGQVTQFGNYQQGDGWSVAGSTSWQSRLTLTTATQGALPCGIEYFDNSYFDMSGSCTFASVDFSTYRVFYNPVGTGIGGSGGSLGFRRWNGSAWNYGWAHVVTNLFPVAEPFSTYLGRPQVSFSYTVTDWAFNTSSGQDILVGQTFSAAETPEPISCATAAAGVAAIVLLRRRRSARRETGCSLRI